MPRLFNHWLVILVLTAGAVVLRLVDPVPIAQMRLGVFDTYQRISPRPYNPDLPVRIVDIDDRSLEQFGQWPWPRTRVAELIDRLNGLGAATIGLDFIFSEPDRTSPEQLLDSLPKDEAFVRFAEHIAGRKSHDEILGEALAAGLPVLGVILNQSGDSGGHAPNASFAHSGDDPRDFVYSFSGVSGNVEPLERVALGIGALNWIPDADQIVRRVPVISRLDDELFPAFATELLRTAQGASTYVIKSSGASGEESFGAATGVIAAKVGQFEVPTTATGEMWLYYSGTKPGRYVSAGDVLNGNVSPDDVAGRIVLIGTSAAGLFDIRATPLDVAIPGVEVHAEALEQILTGAFLTRPDFALGVEMLFLVALGALMAVLIGTIGPQWTGLAALAMIAAANGASWLAFSEYGWLVDPVYPTLMGVAIYIAGTVASYLLTRIERDRIRHAFGHYLAPSLVKQLAAHPERLTLGGDLRDVSVMFLDVRGFTTIAERMNATELTSFINRFLTPMTDTILAHTGTIDKYMGDAIMAFWNAPLDDPDHARHACDAALALKKRLAEFNREVEADEALGALDLPLPIRFGIGINTGPCCVGNLGSEQRFAYSAIGDDVNIASRLEGQTKTYGVDIILGGSTAADVRDYALAEIDLLQVQGRSEPVQIYALLGDPEMARSDTTRWLLEHHATMVAAFRNRKWALALRALKECAEVDREGRLAGVRALYEERIATFRRRPPAPDWNGVALALTK